MLLGGAIGETLKWRFPGRSTVKGSSLREKATLRQEGETIYLRDGLWTDRGGRTRRNRPFGGTVAFVQVENVLVNEELIKEGLGWVYMRYCKLPLCVEWQGLESEAKFGKRGLWGSSGEVPPWEYCEFKS